MECPPSPPGPRTRTKTARPNVPSPIDTPFHQTSFPRATSDLRPPTKYAAAVMTTTQVSFYEPLCEHENSYNDDNPFCVTSEDKDEPHSPILLTDPARVDTAVADTTDAATSGVEGTPTGKADHGHGSYGGPSQQGHPYNESRNRVGRGRCPKICYGDTPLSNQQPLEGDAIGHLEQPRPHHQLPLTCPGGKAYHP
jgi:hypothetical protein